MVALLRKPIFPLPRNPRFPFIANPFAPLSTAAAAEIDAPPPATQSPETTKTTPSPPAGALSAAQALNNLKSAIRSESDPDRLAALFESGFAHKRFHSDRTIYSLTVQKLARARRRDLIQRLLDLPLSNPAAPQNDGFLARIITLYSTANMPNQAIAAFDRAAAAGRVLADRSLCAVISAFLKAGQCERAVEAFYRIPVEHNITLGLAPHNLLLHALCKSGDFASARKVLAEMSHKPCKPNIESYNTVLDGYLSFKDEEAGFAEILDQIADAGLAPSVVTYNCRITALCRKKEMVNAEKVLDEMIAGDVQPNLASFKILIEGFSAVGDMESALRVFERMKVKSAGTDNKDDLAPDANTYNVLMRGLIKKGEFGTALEVCKECLGSKQIPPFELVKRLAEGLSGNSMVDEAKDIVERMRAVLNGGVLDAWKKVENEIYFSDINDSELVDL